MMPNNEKERKNFGKKGKRSAGFQRKDAIVGVIFCTPWIFGFCVFFLYPLSVSVSLAFSQMLDIRDFSLSYNGLANFRDIFIKDVNYVPLLIDSVVQMVIKTPVVVVFSLFIAILLNRKIHFKGLFRISFLLPVLLGTGVVMNQLRGNSSVVTLAQNISIDTGSDQGYTGLGVSQQVLQFLGPQISYYVYIVLGVLSDVLWMSGIQIILFLGSLQTIPESYYEAALCDGASEWEKFWKVTLPLIAPVTLLVIVYTIIDFLTSIDNGVIKYISDATFKNMDLTTGSAMSWIYFIIVGLIVAIVFGVFAKRQGANY